MAKENEAKNDFRDVLSNNIVLASVIGVILIAVIVILYGWIGKGTEETVQMVFTATLPLFGAWVGTILAFYYGRENFEASTRSFTKIAESVGLTEKLEGIPVKDKMIAEDQIKPKEKVENVEEAEQINLKVIIDELSKEERERIPILYKDNVILYMIHRSAIDRYLAQKALAAQATPNPQELTLKNLINDNPELANLFKRSFGFVKKSATLADAKAEMERLPKCQDVFVTETGNKDEPIIGWVTNNIIQEAGKL